MLKIFSGNTDLHRDHLSFSGNMDQHRDSLGFVSCHGDETPRQKQLRGESIAQHSSQFQLQPVIARKSQQQECGRAGHVTSTVRSREQGMHACWLGHSWLSPFHSVQGAGHKMASPPLWVRWVFPLQLTQLTKSFSGLPASQSNLDISLLRLHS